MSRHLQYKGRLILVALAITACFGLVLSRLVELHVLNREHMLTEIEQKRQRFDRVDARRGNIVDARGNLLAATQSVIEVGMDPHSIRLEDVERFPDLARILGIPVSRIETAAATKRREVAGPNGPELRLVQWHKLADGVSEPMYDEIQKLGIRGVYGNRRYQRIYPAGGLAAHLIGFLNREETPTMGAELAMDYYLRGQDGWRESERDGRRRELAQFRNREVGARDGLHLQLTVDWFIQHVVEAEIQDLVNRFNPKGVSIVVSEPATGHILALANYPTFDPNSFNTFPVDSMRNRALSDLLEPGSTFKIVPAAGALNERLVVPTDRFDCSASQAEYRGRLVGLPRDSSPMGDSSVRDIVVKSSNRGAAHLGIRLGADRLHGYARDFGFGERSGLGLSGEVPGVLHDVRNWDGITITRLPMGHAVAATPLQIHMAMSVIANDGIMMEPRLFRRVFSGEGDTLVSFQPRAVRRVVSVDTARIMAEMLVEAAGPGGTARRAMINGFRVGGKTGTTQKIVNGTYSSQHHVASFSGFFPASRPRVVITVIVDEPQLAGSGYGGVVSAPAFRSIGEQIIPYLGIEPESSGDPRYLAGSFPEGGGVP